MGENQSSPRESRSPVVFHSNAPSGDKRKSHAKPNQTSGSVSSSSEDEASEEEEESEDDTAEKDTDTKVKTEIKETQETSEDEDESGSDSEERKDKDVEMPDVPAQRSSPELPSHARKNMVSPLKVTNQRKSPSSDGDNTQDEVDLQLTSDFLEAQGSFSSPAKRPTIRPNFSFGASLSSLNSQKGAMFKPKPTTNVKPNSTLSSQLLKKEFSESESEEESDSDDSSDDDDVPIPPSSQIIPPSAQANGRIAAAAKKAKNAKNAKNDSDSDSDSSEDGAAAMAEARRSLIEAVYSNGMSASQNNLSQSSQVSANGGALGKTDGNGKGNAKSRSAGKEFAKKGKDRITNGYEFKSYGSFN